MVVIFAAVFHLLDLRISFIYRRSHPIQPSHNITLQPGLAAGSEEAQSIVVDDPPAVTPPAAELAIDSSWRDGLSLDDINHKYDQVLESCRLGKECGRNNDKLVSKIATEIAAATVMIRGPCAQIILAYGHFAQTIWGSMQGENIWCDSVVRHIDNGVIREVLLIFVGR